MRFGPCGGGSGSNRSQRLGSRRRSWNWRCDRRGRRTVCQRPAARQARSVHRPARAWHSVPAACREAARRVPLAVARRWGTARAAAPQPAAVPAAALHRRAAAAERPRLRVAAEEEAAAEYPRLLAAARPVPTAAARPWVTAEVPQPAAVREAALRPQEAVAVVAAVAPQSGDPSVVAWQARRSAGPAVSGGQAAALPPGEAGARDAVGAVAAAPRGGRRRRRRCHARGRRRRWRRRVRRRWRRWGRHMRRRRRRCRMRRRRWRRRGPRGRRCGGWRRSRRRSSLWRLPGLSVGTQFLLGLGHDQRRGLRMRRRSNQLHRRQRGRGKQDELKVCHDGLNPRRFPGSGFGN